MNKYKPKLYALVNYKFFMARNLHSSNRIFMYIRYTYMYSKYMSYA